jgi:hypothetical protein
MLSAYDFSEKKSRNGDSAIQLSNRVDPQEWTFYWESEGFIHSAQIKGYIFLGKVKWMKSSGLIFFPTISICRNVLQFVLLLTYLLKIDLSLNSFLWDSDVLTFHVNDHLFHLSVECMENYFCYCLKGEQYTVQMGRMKNLVIIF